MLVSIKWLVYNREYKNRIKGVVVRYIYFFQSWGKRKDVGRIEIENFVGLGFGILRRVRFSWCWWGRYEISFVRVRILRVGVWFLQRLGTAFGGNGFVVCQVVFRRYGRFVGRLQEFLQGEGGRKFFYLVLRFFLVLCQESLWGSSRYSRKVVCSVLVLVFRVSQRRWAGG